jgi:membrane associated rhomboid family serine protease
MAFFQNSRPGRAPFLNAPPVVLWLIGLMLALHAARVYAPASWQEDILLRFALIPERYAEAFSSGVSGLNDLFDLLVPFVGYTFLHGDFVHVGVNSLWLLAFGPIVARRLGTAKFLIFFFVSGAIAALTHLIVYWGDPMPVVGASGAVSGLMGAGMRIFYGHMMGVPLAPLKSRPILGFSLMWVIGNIITGIFRIGVADGVSLVAWVAHLGGYFAGLVLIGWFDRSLKVPAATSA